MTENVQLETATLAGGCFWCTEAIIKRLKGVRSVTSGYAGGHLPNPTYEMIHQQNTGYAESIQVEFDPQVISYKKILEIFFAMHDPTTPNRQGNDIGPEYRSMIFYHNAEQKEIAEKVKSALEKSAQYQSPLVTEIVPYTSFYQAEHEHQNFYDNNSNHPYCHVIIDPKIKKLLDHYRPFVKLTP